eukprot:TRINITY_DN10298_c0_g3_i1.p1 TRINITY_DN10298_c0_g3~~TRINITY_DN10298_c0_g3_i1.p1  ORF type:complete len:134 (-),score=13.97 TRINITY_DN10298_c0_g3_i1:176-577(-)
MLVHVYACLHPSRKVHLMLYFSQPMYACVPLTECAQGNPEGVIMVRYFDDESLGPAIATLNGRWFDQRQIVAEEWDGKTKYKVKESKEVLVEADKNFWIGPLLDYFITIRTRLLTSCASNRRKKRGLRSGTNI